MYKIILPNNPASLQHIKTNFLIMLKSDSTN